MFTLFFLIISHLLYTGIKVFTSSGDNIVHHNDTNTGEPCRCHPIGSIVRHDCDRRSGQCRCKQGVAGLTCDRCQDGYHQTRSPLNPCTKDFTSRAVAWHIHPEM
ncbi:unnamed protein product [Heterobilharzia americana]|nr:unnamed protein product [Heterobilharzia americana]